MTERDGHLIERLIDSREILKGNFLHALRDQVLLPDGSTSSREYIQHPGAVMIVGILDNGHVVLERQYRHPLRQVIVEFPAGKIDPGETGLACAQRELLEETGYRATHWAWAGRLHPVVSYSTEVIEVWFARELAPGLPQLDQGEVLEVFDAPPDELIRWCLQGQVTDAKTIVGAFWMQSVLSGATHLDWMPCGPGAFTG